MISSLKFMPMVFIGALMVHSEMKISGQHGIARSVEQPCRAHGLCQAQLQASRASTAGPPKNCTGTARHDQHLQSHLSSHLIAFTLHLFNISLLKIQFIIISRNLISCNQTSPKGSACEFHLENSNDEHNNSPFQQIDAPPFRQLCQAIGRDEPLSMYSTRPSQSNSLGKPYARPQAMD